MKSTLLSFLILCQAACWAAAQEHHRLILDWFPNADHVPLYVAREAGFFEAQGLDIELLPPADPNDPLKLVAAGQASVEGAHLKQRLMGSRGSRETLRPFLPTPGTARPGQPRE